MCHNVRMAVIPYVPDTRCELCRREAGPRRGIWRPGQHPDTVYACADCLRALRNGGLVTQDADGALWYTAAPNLCLP